MNQKEIREGLDILRKIPEAEILTKKCLCGDKISILENNIRIYSGVINYDESICQKCRKRIKGMSRMVCIKCRSLIGYIPPDKHNTGFKFQPNRHYHVNGCFKCEPGNYATSVLELERWCAERNIPTNKDMERVAEYEKKAGQVDKQASELKATLDSQRPNNQ